MINPFFKNELTTLYNGDCRDLISEVIDQCSIDLVFVDPPFNIDWGYDVWKDDLSITEYFNFLNEVITKCFTALKDGGVCLFHVSDDMVPIVFDITKNINNVSRIDWIIWHYQFGQCVKSKFIKSKEHCLVYKKGNAKHIFNAEEIMVSSLRASKYNDKRTLKSQNPGLRVPLDVFTDIPRLNGNSQERIQHGRNQLPEKYLERFIKAYTNPGNMILDPTCGTGTTIAVGQKLGRRSIGIEISSDYCSKIVERLNRD